MNKVLFKKPVQLVLYDKEGKGRTVRIEHGNVTTGKVLETIYYNYNPLIKEMNESFFEGLEKIREGDDKGKYALLLGS
jgi:hypothetical protein